jgi:acetyl-CoA acetyltransferase
MFRVRYIHFHMCLDTDISQQAIKNGNVNPEIIDDICVGTVLGKGPTYEARTAALAAGIPESVPIQTVNRFCSSGLMAVTAIANEIRAGQIDVGLAIGVESMSWKWVTASYPCGNAFALMFASQFRCWPGRWKRRHHGLRTCKRRITAYGLDKRKCRT